MAAVAEPVLASSLWNPDPLETTPAKQRLRTNCKTIDTALNEGLGYGYITCISAEADFGARDIAQALLVSHLCESQDATATVIDTGQAINVRRLYQAILDTLTRGDGEAPKAQAKAALDRVKLMKPFDFEGLTEGVSELRNALEGRVPHEQPPRGTVADSQDDEEEMLDSPTPSVLRPATVHALPVPTTNRSNGLLIIDNITQLAAPLVKSNHASGQALVTSFMRSLAHLTRTHSLCTIVMNSTISTKTTNYKEESPSAFSSCSVRPALGKTWTHLVDVHLLVHQMPKKERDAKVLYGGQRADGVIEMVSVVEVLQDGYDGRVGKWAAFSVSDDGKLEDVVRGV